ncbi:hypothetical protein CAPTEDRAFT_193155 [Capitella teleta]|uniref:Receptor ligand binding region domain-containing protein n=1 Tax=Capitella teleta TaxID=283909 RepID=R7UNI2_CAPTE|nr:hypothetical protein CAPTEDRAFT_193155 [Capitella teleta]|eukprot:ELU07785.1 hypothetical protein CAPTEDRAFT_193155 [Capitella teleta]
MTAATWRASWLLVVLLSAASFALDVKIGYIENRVGNHRGPAALVGIRKFLDENPKYKDVINVTITPPSKKSGSTSHNAEFKPLPTVCVGDAWHVSMAISVIENRDV